MTQQIYIAQSSESLMVQPRADGFVINYEKEALSTIQKAARKLVGFGVSDVKLAGAWSAEQQYAFAQAYLLPSSKRKLRYGEGLNSQQQAWLEAHIETLCFVRELVNLSPEALSPLSLASKAVAWLEQISETSLKTHIIQGEALEEAGYHGIYQVGRGSDRPPVLLEVDYNPHEQENVDFALVGKGITFDSGGYSIKASEGMLDMKCDMAGAATIVGALGLAIRLGLNKRVKLFLCCAENLISGHAYKLGDVITYKNGLSVEIVNTDAEGRLVLADGLLAANDAGAAKIIDAATLTGAAVAALGNDYNALFSMHEAFASEALDKSASVNEALWRLPLAKFHQHKCPSPFADTANSRPQKGGGAGGASNAAGFLSRFVDLQASQWLHFDLAAAYNRNGSETMAEGGSALGVRTIASLLLSQ